MVICNSDSDTSLVSLDHDGDHRKQQQLARSCNSTLSHQQAVPSGSARKHILTLYPPQATEVFVDSLEDIDNGEHDCWDERTTSSPEGCSDCSTANDIDESDDDDDDDSSEKFYLSCIPPQLRKASDVLFSVPPVQFTAASNERLLYVHQGEVAHATLSQTDVLVSDHATTCHILALRSVVGRNDNGDDDDDDALGSLTHLDDTMYESCLRKMIHRHWNYHHDKQRRKCHHPCSSNEEEKKNSDVENDEHCDASVVSAHSRHHRRPTMTLEIHILGGMAHETSRKLSNWLIRVLANTAGELPDVRFVLKTCAVSSLNDNGCGAPRGRGLALDLRSGRCYVAECDEAVVGPKRTLRSARIFAPQPSPECRVLTCIHDPSSSLLVIEPFRYAPVPQTNALLLLSDQVLLQYTSTSPHCEADNFCASIRRMLHFLRDTPFHFVFGQECNQPLVYSRLRTSNVWQPVSSNYLHNSP